MRRFNVAIKHISSEIAFRKLLTVLKSLYIKQDRLTVLQKKTQPERL